MMTVEVETGEAAKSYERRSSSTLSILASMASRSWVEGSLRYLQAASKIPGQLPIDDMRRHRT